MGWSSVRDEFCRSAGLSAMGRATLLAVGMLCAPVQANPPEGIQVHRFTPLNPEFQQMRQTEVSRMMRDIERKVNAGGPRFPIAILDDDSINLRPTHNEPSFRNRLDEVLRDRNIQLRWNLKSDVLQPLGGLKGPEGRDPVAVRVTPDLYANSANPLDTGITQSFMCLVIPPVADVSSRRLLEKWLGQAGPTHMQARHDPGPYALMLRATWHEIWHCLDTEFYRDEYIVKGDKAIDNALRMHMAEVFADVAATLTMATMGYPEMARDMADIRALSSYWNGRRSVTGTRSSDESYYEGAVYFVSRAQEMMHRHIQEAGTARLATYGMEDIARIAGEITRAGALDKDEFKLLSDFYARGDSYIVALKAEAERGSRETEKKYEFLTAIRTKAQMAKERLLVDLGQAVTRDQGYGADNHRDAADILKEISPEEKRVIEALVHVRAMGARLRGEAPEQGVVALIDDWRRDVHGAGERHPERERQLYVLSLMLSYGELDSALGRQGPFASSRFAPPQAVPMRERLDFGPQS